MSESGYDNTVCALCTSGAPEGQNEGRSRIQPIYWDAMHRNTTAVHFPLNQLLLKNCYCLLSLWFIVHTFLHLIMFFVSQPSRSGMPLWRPRRISSILVIPLVYLWLDVWICFVLLAYSLFEQLIIAINIYVRSKENQHLWVEVYLLGAFS